jgi:DNA polymerase-3 subunit delta
LTRERQARLHVIAGGKAFDSFLAEQALEKLLSAAVGDDRADAVEVFQGDETTWARVLEALRTRSLFAPRRAVVVRRADALKGDDEDAAACLDAPAAGTTLILLVAKPDKRRAVWKRIFDAAEVVPAEPLRGYKLRGYVTQELRRRGLGLPEAGVDELIERVGQDLRRLMGEVEKLEAFALGSRGLTADEVAAVLGRGLAQPLYRLADALGARRPGEVLDLMEEVLEEGEAPLRVLGTMHRALRQVRAARSLRGGRIPQSELASLLRIPPFKVADAMRAAERWSEGALRGAFTALERADGRIKTGTEPRVALAAAVAEACRE